MRIGVRIVAWVPVLAAALGCGGQVVASGDGGPASASSSSGGGSGGGSGGASGSGGGSGGGSSGVTVPPCPSEPPVAGSHCIAPGQQNCAYVTAGQGCHAFVCDDASVWQSTPAGC